MTEVNWGKLLDLYPFLNEKKEVVEGVNKLVYVVDDNKIRVFVTLIEDDVGVLLAHDRVDIINEKDGNYGTYNLGGTLPGISVFSRGIAIEAEGMLHGISATIELGKEMTIWHHRHGELIFELSFPLEEDTIFAYQIDHLFYILSELPKDTDEAEVTDTVEEYLQDHTRKY